MSKVRLAIAGVGNCANSLLQGVTYYADAEPDTEVPGLMNVELSGYHVGDVEFVAAFDVDAAKVGQDLAKAIWAAPNNTIRFCRRPTRGCLVQRGPTLDGLGKYYREPSRNPPRKPSTWCRRCATSGADVLVSYLPVGSEEAPKFYAEAASRPGSRSSTHPGVHRFGSRVGATLF